MFQSTRTSSGSDIFVRTFLRIIVIVVVMFPIVCTSTATPNGAIPTGMTFTVTSSGDDIDALPGDGTCAVTGSSEKCTLRAAVQETNALSGADTIILPAGTYTFVTSSGLDEDATNGDLDIGDELTITGAGAGSTIIDGNGSVTSDRVFDVGNRKVASISGVTIRNGSDTYGFGGGAIRNNGTLTVQDVIISANGSGGNGGAISNGYENPSAALVLKRVIIDGNGASHGGGLNNAGILTVEDSTLTNNSALAGGGLYNLGNASLNRVTLGGNNGQFGGGGIYNAGTLALTNTTISSNTGTTASAPGTAINNTAHPFTSIPGSTTVTNGTIAGNTTEGNVAMYNDPGNTIRVQNTIIANPSAANCNGTITSLGHNLENGKSCGLVSAGDLMNTDPRLGPLLNNGGPTLTHALLQGSLAIDGGSNQACPTVDQRGVTRPIDGNGDGTDVCDIGSYEADAGPVGVSSVMLPLILR